MARSRTGTCSRTGTLVLLGLLGLAARTLADGTRDCPSQLAGVGLARVVQAPPSTCSLPTEPNALVAAVVESPASAATCGRCLRVSGPAGSVEVLVVGVVEATKGHTPGDLLLSSAARQALGTGLSPISVSWLSTACSGERTIEMDVARPTNAEQGLQLVVRGHRTGLATITVDSTNRPIPLERGAANTFSTVRAVGNGPWSLTLTDVHGRTVRTTVARVGPRQPTQVQFPKCSQVFSDGFEGGDLSAWGRPSP